MLEDDNKKVFNAKFQGSFSHNSQNSKSFFTKTNQILESISNMSVFDANLLHNGIKYDYVENSHKLFLKLNIGAQLHLAIAYNHIIDEREYTKEGSPKIHFIKCRALEQIKKEYIKVCIPTHNSFDYRVRSHGMDTRIFYEKPLRLCKLCVLILNQIIKNNEAELKEEEIMGLILKNKLKNLFAKKE